MTRRRLIDSHCADGPGGAEFHKRATLPAGRDLLRSEHDHLVDIHDRLTRSNRPHARNDLRAPTVLRVREDDVALELHLDATLGEPLASLHPLSDDRLMSIFDSLTSAVDELHGLGWVHGRLSADHVIVAPDDSVTLCSWSDARADLDVDTSIDRLALRSMFIELGGHQTRLHDSHQIALRRRLLSMHESAAERPGWRPTPGGASSGPAFRGAPTRSLGDEISTGTLIGAGILCMAAIPLLWWVQGYPSVAPLAEIGDRPVDGVLGATTWAAYLLAVWGSLSCGVAGAARLAGWTALADTAVRWSPFRQRGATALLTGSMLLVGVNGMTGGSEPVDPPRVAQDAVPLARTGSPTPGSPVLPHEAAAPPEHAATTTSIAESIHGPVSSRTPTAHTGDDAGHDARAPAARPVSVGANLSGTAASDNAASSRTATPHRTGVEPVVTDPSTDSPFGAADPALGEPGTTWTIEPGDHLWSIAERITPATDASSIQRTWTDLIDLNRDRLVHPDDPDLILPGQVLRLPMSRR